MTARRREAPRKAATPRTSAQHGRTRAAPLRPSASAASFPSADWADAATAQHGANAQHGAAFHSVSVGQAAVRQSLRAPVPTPRTFGDVITARGGPPSPRGAPEPLPAAPPPPPTAAIATY